MYIFLPYKITGAERPQRKMAGYMTDWRISEKVKVHKTVVSQETFERKYLAKV